MCRRVQGLLNYNGGISSFSILQFHARMYNYISNVLAHPNKLLQIRALQISNENEKVYLVCQQVKERNNLNLLDSEYLTMATL